MGLRTALFCRSSSWALRYSNSCQDQVLLGAEVIVDLAERHAGFRRDFAGRQARIAVLTQHLLGGLEQARAGLDLLYCRARHVVSRCG